jgi:putative tricarboxylic transport membrane protein
MNRRGTLDARAWDQIAGAAGVTLGALLGVLGWRLGFGAWNNPGPGMMAVLTGLFIALLSATLWIVTLRRTGHPDGMGASPWASAHWGPVLATLGALLAYAALLDTLGYVVATFLLLVVLLRVLEPPAWSSTVIAALLIAVASHALFARLLQVQLPRASWGF